MRSCCFGCEHERDDKNQRRCVTCKRRLALLDTLEYMAQDRRRDAEAFAVSRGITRYHGQPETWPG